MVVYEYYKKVNSLQRDG